METTAPKAASKKKISKKTMEIKLSAPKEYSKTTSHQSTFTDDIILSRFTLNKQIFSKNQRL